MAAVEQAFCNDPYMAEEQLREPDARGTRRAQRRLEARTRSFDQRSVNVGA